MKKGKSWLRWAAFLTVSIGCIYGTGPYCLTIAEVPARKRADVIKIDFMTAFGKLEQSPVEFLHDAHTDTLAKKNKDCKTCHMQENDRIYPKFKRLKDTNRIDVMNIYHEGCISCHGEMKVAHEKSGPVECDGCHNQKEQYASSRQAMGFDKSLHFRHSKAMQNKCEQCHHEYDKNSKTLFYAKGKEGTCRYCHNDETKDNRISMRLAAHTGCIKCHRKIEIEKQNKKLAKESISPPLKCLGCHDPFVQQKIKKMTTISRMDRKQPDIVLLKPAQKEVETDKNTGGMNFVPFDHKAHEYANNTCRVCHHESLQPCGECHTLKGSAHESNVESIGGKAVTLEKAMHMASSTRSCVGCHDASKQTQNCVGCHVFIKNEHNRRDTSCLKCHAVPVHKMRRSSDSAYEKSIAELAFRSRTRITRTYRKDDIPEKVMINRLSKQYEAVDFPHRKVVNALVDHIKDSKLVGYFHDHEGTVCQGCHHNSPVSKNPPHCGNCHAQQWDEDNPAKPGIIGAYHQQCMGCHKKMNIDKPIGCTECHKLKNVN
mmetsp:Transcript_22013/g.10362  ORF Transcript_22013/g.10362 Transcript_22013/m.10362 type:complete len:542 (-) Transcript_22013:1300-2925(-)